MSAVLSGFTYWYPETQRAALEDVNLTLDGGVCAIVGPSGSGKSTLLRVCNGLVPHFHGGHVAGRATVFGHDVVRTPTRVLSHDVGFVFQDPELQSVYPTVEHDVAFGLENIGVPRARMQTRVEDALSHAGIAALRGRAVNTLSGGERQRLALAGVLAMRPRLLALDEPLSQLDADGVRALLSTLSDIATAGTTVVVAEHRMQQLAAIAQCTVRIDAGRITGSTIAEHPTVLPASPMRTLAGGEVWWLDNVSAGPTRTPLLEGVTLAGGAGEVVALTGANGSGKTTLLRTIAGLLAPLRGTARHAPGIVAYLPQNPGALLHRPTVRAEVEWTLRHRGAMEPADTMLSAFGLTGLGERYPRDLSSGEQQRAAITAVLAGDPALVLLDEPTRGMDDVARVALHGAIERLAARGAAVVLATHDLDLARSVAHRAVTIAEGVVREAPQAEPAWA